MHLALGCALGVQALHNFSSTLVHRDIKSFNFLVDSQLEVKIADLELGCRSRTSYGDEEDEGDDVDDDVERGDEGSDEDDSDRDDRQSLGSMLSFNTFADQSAMISSWQAPEVRATYS